MPPDNIENNILLKVFLVLTVLGVSLLAAKFILTEKGIENRINNIEEKVNSKPEKEVKETKEVKKKDNKDPTCSVEIASIIQTLNNYFSERGLEDTLVNIISKQDGSKCTLCTPKEKKAILQIKMMLQLRVGNIKKAEEIMDKIKD